MNVKTDTKEKFTVITPLEEHITANMTAEILNFAEYAQKDIPHIVINMEKVQQIEDNAAKSFAIMQQGFYELQMSCVICCIQPSVLSIFEQEDLIDTMNITPTESEAWDIVQMEEIERELLNDFEN